LSIFEKLGHATAEAPADFLLTGDDWNGSTPDAMTPAAVLVPIVDRPEPGLLLTVRTAHLRHHAGQIAFPGGRAEPGETAEDAALREAGEEIGLSSNDARIVGTGDPYRTITGFIVTPVIAVIAPGLALRPGDGEVEELFEVPLAFVTDPAQHRVKEVLWQGRKRSYYEIFWHERRIWGATAAIIVNLSRRIGRAG